MDNVEQGHGQANDLASVAVAKTQYNEQSEEYKRSKQATWREHVERQTAERLIATFGGVKGKGVIDLVRVTPSCQGV